MFYVEVNGKLSIQIEIYSLLGKVCCQTWPCMLPSVAIRTEIPSNW